MNPLKMVQNKTIKYTRMSQEAVSISVHVSLLLRDKSFKTCLIQIGGSGS